MASLWRRTDTCATKMSNTEANEMDDLCPPQLQPLLLPVLLGMIRRPSESKTRLFALNNSPPKTFRHCGPHTGAISTSLMTSPWYGPTEIKCAPLVLQVYTRLLRYSANGPNMVVLQCQVCHGNLQIWSQPLLVALTNRPSHPRLWPISCKRHKTECSS